MPTPNRLLLLLLILCCNAFADTVKTPEEEIKSVLFAQQNAWNRGDIDGYMEGYWKSDKLRFASEGAYKFGWQATLKGYKKNYPDKSTMGTLTFILYDINLITEDAALVFGSWKLEREKDKPHGLFTLLLRKKEQGWKIVADHTSSASQ